MGSWRYVKGAHAERELLALLQQKGFKVVRAAGSGVQGDCPDLLALSSTRKFAVECKAWKKAVYIDKPKFIQMEEWEKATGMPVLLAWKPHRKNWAFFPLSAMRETSQSHTVGEGDLALGMTLEEITAASRA
ncbi:MAG: Holliday junction resolvase Hjc [Candidatus Micrarchaeota archaeon]